ncbi:hypothetical protein [Rhodococcus sp. 27YEA15]|uniref:hypothetical protein n=1 Tax=Rhodococcus sp. 27YEA15 TaxID=3156259 RepID=UPI003C7B784A
MLEFVGSVVVERGRVHPTRPHLHVVETSDVSTTVIAGQLLRVRRRGAVGPGGVARVWEINHRHEMVYLNVEWDEDDEDESTSVVPVDRARREPLIEIPGG